MIIKNKMKLILYPLLITFLFWGCGEGFESPTDVYDDAQLNKIAAGSKGGSALDFDGAVDYVVVEDDPSLDMTDGFTIAAWIYIDSYTEWASFVTKGGTADGGDQNNYTIHQSGPGGVGSEFGHLRFTGASASLPVNPYLESNTQIPLNEWHFVAVTFDGAELNFYLDGVNDGGGALGELSPNDEPLHIGVDFPGGDEYWHGKIDEVRIWNKSLKAKHIRAAMHGHASPLASALAGYWRFDDGTGDVALDRSPNNNDGLLIGDPTWVSPGAPH